MADTLTKKQRSFCMSRIKSTKTKPELALLEVLKKKGFVYQPIGLFGKPDFIHSKNKEVVFVDGCFWHGCPKHYRQPKSNRAYWIPKIKRNMTRAAEVGMAYKALGWRVKRVMECEI